MDEHACTIHLLLYEMKGSMHFLIVSGVEPLEAQEPMLF